MACHILDLTVVGVGDPPGSIVVSGRAEDCSKVIVTLACGGVVLIEEADVVAGAWSVSFVPPAGCTCGENILVKAECEGNPNCREVFEGPLECEPSEEACPVVSDIGVVPAPECNDDRTRHVTLTAHISNGGENDAVMQWTDFGDGVPGGAFVVDAGEEDDFSAEHDYEAGDYVATLSVVLPEGCPSVAVEVHVPECPGCLDRNQIDVDPLDCVAGGRQISFTFPFEITAVLTFGDGDEAEFIGTRQVHTYTPRAEPYTAVLVVEGCDPIEIEVLVETCGCLTAEDVRVEPGECDAQGRRTVTFRFPYAIPADLDYGDDTVGVHFDADRTSHAYVAPGEYTATLMQEGCEPVRIPFEVEACPCLTADDVTVTPGDCNGDDRRNVVFDFPREIEGELDFGDGTPAAGFRGSRQTHAYEAGSYEAVLSVEGCDPVTLQVDVAPCNGGGGGGGGEPSACGSLALVVAALLGLALGSALLLFVLQVCLGVNVPWFVWLIPVGFAVAAGVVIALWYLFCDDPTECDWLAIAWIVSLILAIVMLYLSNCCPGIGIAIAIGLFAAAAAGFAAWVARCHPDNCQILDYLAVAVVTGAGSVISFLVIPVVAALIAPCVMPWVAVAAGLLGGGLVLAAAACHAAE